MKWEKYFRAFSGDDCISPPVLVTDDWISYKDYGWNPLVHKDVLAKVKRDAEVIREALEKWEKEFGKKSKQE